MRVQRTMQTLGAWLLASCLATEVFAWTRGFHPWLGQPLLHAGVWPVYHPLTIWRWLWAWGWRALRYDGEVHTLIVAPTGSGKTTTTGIPTTLTWRHSLFVHDPKGELREHSARWRSRFSRIVSIDPTSPESDCYDPLRAIRLDSTH